MEKELFIESMLQLQKQYEYDAIYAQQLSVALMLDEEPYYNNHFIINQFIKILQVQMNDDAEPSLIEHFISEEDFGKSPHSTNTAEILYNNLILRKNENN
ncbi:hypothetical protein LXD69_10240 [Flavobacterium sediminilitoris]|uniref:Uncharacterized protein n=1 Tax=Flavobacterium sediminilitoris TaxID=2024526 RepID=A0ABY4HJ98_9FLAO|nr:MULTISPECIES: hypothetical protein [Flavobacterium]UOX32431.1 hypothetical protein LXD69_10240 [Flavobacterium sediminilitoris]